MGHHEPMDASTRIVVIGGGIVAASVAYHLARVLVARALEEAATRA